MKLDFLQMTGKIKSLKREQIRCVSYEEYIIRPKGNVQDLARFSLISPAANNKTDVVVPSPVGLQDKKLQR